MKSTNKTAEGQKNEISLVKIACPLCNSADSSPVCKVIDATYDIPGEYTVVCCTSCRHLYLNPRPRDECIMACYPTTYAPYEGHAEDSCAETSDTAGLVRPKSALRSAFRAIPGLRRFLIWLGEENATHLPTPPESGGTLLLEVGCAHGGFLSRAAQAGWTVDGVEPSEQAALSATRQGFKVFCGTLAEADISSNSRDAIAMWMVLEHVPDPVQVLEEVFAILKPGGYFMFSVPNAAAPERWVLGRYWLGYDAPRHLQDFRATRLQKLLLEQGFADVQMIHQANTRYWYGSIAAWGKQRFPSHRWPERWMEYFRNEPPSHWKWALLLPGKLMSILRCSGRITVIARKPKD